MPWVFWMGSERNPLVLENFIRPFWEGNGLAQTRDVVLLLGMAKGEERKLR